MGSLGYDGSNSKVSQNLLLVSWAIFISQDPIWYMSNLFMGSNKIHISLMMLKHSQNSLCFVIITVFVCELVLFFFFSPGLFWWICFDHLPADSSRQNDLLFERMHKIITRNFAQERNFLLSITFIFIGQANACSKTFWV